MDRLNQLRGEAGGSRDSTLDTSSPPSEAFMTANESSSKYFSLSEVDSTFDISPIKDVSLASANMDSDKPIPESDQLLSNLSPIGKKSDFLDTYKIGKQIEAANILSGGVAIFEDNDNSYDGDELVIDDNAEIEDKSNPEMKLVDAQFKDENSSEGPVEAEAVGSKDSEVILQIDGKNVDAIDIGNGLYLYRKDGQEELAAVQIIDDDQQQPNFKFLKVRENAEGNLEVYEEIQIEVPKEVPMKEEKVVDKKVSHVPIKDINKVMSEPTSNIIADKKIRIPNVAKPAEVVVKEPESEVKRETQHESTSEGNCNKKMKFSESRKSPVIGSFTPMKFHSTPNKEPIPLTKTMVDQQLHPSRHSDNIKKTIEVHTDVAKQRVLESPVKQTKEINEDQSKQPQIEKILTEDKNSFLESGEGNKEVLNEPTDEAEKSDQSTTENKIDINETKDDTLTTSNNQGDLGITQTKIDSNLPNVNADMEIRSLTSAPAEIIQSEEEIKEKKEETNMLTENVEIKQSKDTVCKAWHGNDSPVLVETTITDVPSRMENLEKTEIDGLVLEQQKTELDALKENEVLQGKEENVNKKVRENDMLPQEAEISVADIAKSSDTTEEPVSEKLPEHSDDTKTPINEKLNKVVDTDLRNVSDDKNDVVEVLALVEGNNQNDISNKIDSNNSETKNTVVDGSGIESNKVQEKNTGDVKSSDLNIVIEKSVEINMADKELEINKSEEINKPVNDLKSDRSCEINKQNDLQGIKEIEKINKLDENRKQVEDIKPVENLKIIQTNKDLEKNTTDSKEKLIIDLKRKVNEKDIKTTLPVTENKTDIVSDTSAKSADVSKGTDLASIAAADNVVPSKSIPQVQTCVAKSVEGSETKKLDIKPIILQKAPQTKNETADKKLLPKFTAVPDQKPINNNHAPVPFGKWTDVNRQAFLNKIKESKVPTNSSNGKQIKNSNDLNRRDVLKKIDSQRQSSIATAKALELANTNKAPVKNETVFVSKSSIQKDSKPAVKTEAPIAKTNPVLTKKIPKQVIVPKHQAAATNTVSSAMINNQHLIDRTIEDIINRAVPVKAANEDVKQTAAKDASKASKSDKSQPPTQASLDEIEMKMNELHGIPFIERPPHELPHVPKPTSKTTPQPELQKPSIKPSKIPNLLPFVTKTLQKSVKENVIDIDSEEEVIEHEPITGDMDLTKKVKTKQAVAEKAPIIETMTLISADSSKKETIITENDFDKFVRRNSISYENCLTVTYDGTEPLHNLVQTIVHKDTGLKIYSKTENLQSNVKTESSRKLEQVSQKSVSIISGRNVTKYEASNIEDDNNKNYQSKVKMAYQTAMTAKRQQERPITIIEDKPVKVVFTDSNMEFIPSQLNVQGKLSPTKKPGIDIATTQSDSLDSDTLDSIDDSKVDEIKFKTKHQRKQVLTPVETPELELIEPNDLGIEVSPKKKRRTEEKVEKPSKTLVPKKTYLLGRGHTAEEYISKPFDLSKAQRQSSSQDSAVVSHKNAASAIDSLVKAAELLETQSGNITTKPSDVFETQQNTPVKRGRGRPRKNPLPEGIIDKTKVPSPQKKPRLIDAKVVKNKETDEDDDQDDDYDDDDDSIDSAMVKENWTMGKINENIVCPICNKLFRSENVVFKHVKHCTGPSPSRSDSENKSPRRLRDSQGSETKSFGSKSDDMDVDETESSRKNVRKKRKSRETHSKEIGSEKDEIIVIEDTPIKPKVDKRDISKVPESRKTIPAPAKNKVTDKVSSLVCEFCGKTFRQLSYLVNHKLQHGKDESKKVEEENPSKNIFNCEICKKEFRKLHHLVQHRLIHSTSVATAKTSRQSSSEQSDSKSTKEGNSSKQSDDASAGFRCEPCDKSFRKLHHLVEHRETHDGINRQKTEQKSEQKPTVPTEKVEKPQPPPQCEVCKKTFRKLHHLVEHKEQHLETSSEKSDDKSIKSSLSTKDIIHECSLCYMVFPNEHSLTKHTIICQRKKRQSATKQAKQTDEDGNKETEVDKDSNLDKEAVKGEENKGEKDDDVTIVSEKNAVEATSERLDKVNEIAQHKTEQLEQTIVEKRPIVEDTIKSVEPKVQVKESLKTDNDTEKSDDEIIANIIKRSKMEENLPLKVKKLVDKESKPKTQDTLRKKTPSKDKVAPTVTKRHKPNSPLPVIENTKLLESSDDDEVRYMLNPAYKPEDNEGKLFMKVRASKRNSLQIERPNSKDLVKRRISLQHPPKIPRLKPKPVQAKAPLNKTINTKTITKTPKLEPVPSTDSDDSDVKYSFPKPSSDKPLKVSLPENAPQESVKKTQRKSLAEKRKSLSSIAKKKSLGQAVIAKHKPKPSPLKQIRKRTAEVEHRCDCGQLFSSAALLSRHTTLAHTPPRIRRRRSPPPDLDTTTKPAPRKSLAPSKTNTDSRKSSIKSDTNPNPRTTTKRKSSFKPDPKTPAENRKTPKTSDKTDTVKSATTNVKLRRYAAHKGVPVPEKMRKLMEKSKK